MRLNVINVLNEIERENASEVLLNEFMESRTYGEDYYNTLYADYKMDIEYDNNNTWELIEWEEKHGRDYTSWLKYLKTPLSFEEWYERAIGQYLVN